MTNINLNELLQVARKFGVSEEKITEVFEKHCEPRQSEKVKLKESRLYSKDVLLPGCIVVFNKDKEMFFGIILRQGTIVYFNSLGEIKGYLHNITMDHPYKILRVLSPTHEFYKLSQCNYMDVIWERPKEVKIKKSILDIERELGLSPGTLEIY